MVVTTHTQAVVSAVLIACCIMLLMTANWRVTIICFLGQCGTCSRKATPNPQN